MPLSGLIQEGQGTSVTAGSPCGGTQGSVYPLTHQSFQA